MATSVIFVASEMRPLVQTGGLGDVARALPVALEAEGCKVSVFIPFYSGVNAAGVEIKATGVTVTVPIGAREVTAVIYKAELSGPDVYLVKIDEYFDRTHLYGTPEHGGYFDNLERYAAFTRAVIEAVLALDLRPDIFHCNDWQTGLLGVYLKDAYSLSAAKALDITEKKRAEVVAIGSVPVLFTIHNLAYQGTYEDRLFETLNLSGHHFTHEGIESYGQINMLKAGAAFADIITTVSETYSREIQTPEYGHRLDGFLRHRRADLFGVVNGADYADWNPAIDKSIPQKYSPADMSGKLVCKRALIAEFGLKVRPTTAVVGMVSRLAAQKGFDIIAEAMDRIMKLGVGMVILGEGEAKFRRLIEAHAKKHPGRLSVKVSFDNRLAHLVEAGSDIFLMPSHYEPCGLNQIYSLKYGTIPVVRATGGLEDTVKGHAPGVVGTGFKFKEYTAKAMVAKLKEAVALYKTKPEWAAMVERAMAEDFSWSRSAKKYMELYSVAIGRREVDSEEATGPESA
jgi:starch synthase